MVYINHDNIGNFILIKSDIINHRTDINIIITKLGIYIEKLQEQLIEMIINNNNNDIENTNHTLEIIMCIHYGLRNNIIDLNNPSWNAKYWIKKAMKL